MTQAHELESVSEPGFFTITSLLIVNEITNFPLQKTSSSMEVTMVANSPVRSNLTILYQDIAALNPRKSNPRTHSKKQIEQLARAITQFGFTNPVLIDDANGIIAGHGRETGRFEPGSDGAPLGDERS
jgi:hypothetical protein